MPPTSDELRLLDRNAWVVPRPRLTARIVELTERFGVVWVLGSAGAGKTTAVADAVASTGRATAWLTLDATDTAPGRLLLHLQRALSGALPGLPAVADEALAADVPHVEVAGRVSAAVGSDPVTLVLDEVERLGDAESARAVLASFLRGIGPAVQVVLISRRDVPLALGSARAVGGVGRVSERDLAFSVQEAAEVLALLERPGDDAEEAVRATGGWVAGVLFEAWRSPEHTHGSGGEADALSGYLSLEIMQGLTADQQWFLEATSVLREVTARRAGRLGQARAPELLAGLREHHIPVWLSADGAELRCHPRFREYLRRRLDDRGGPEVEALHAAHGRLLLEEDDPEDAVGAFLLAGDLAAAEDAGERAMPEVLRRSDVDVAEAWLRAFRRATVQRSEVLTRAELAVALEREAWAAGATAADRLLGMLHAEAAAGRLDPLLAGTVGTCMVHMGRFEDAVAVVEGARPGPAREAWRIALGIDVVDRPEHYRDRPPDRDETLDGLLHRIDFMHGRLERLVDDRTAPWAAARSSRIAALRAVGRHHEALALIEAWPGRERSPTMTRVLVDILVDLGRHDEAETALRDGRDVAARSSPYCVSLHLLYRAMLALRVHGDVPAARALLERVEEDPGARRRTRVLDQLGIWRGLAALLDGDATLAATHLREALTTMLHWDRQLFVPTAGVYLAEAEWRLGEEDAADAAMDHALAAARIQGSDHLLLQALHQFPAVLSRRVDAEQESDTAWHALGRVLVTDTTASASAQASGTHLREYGVPEIVHAGVRVDPRLSRSFEVLAHLAAHDGRSSKAVLLVDLFGGGTDDRTRAYLRQALKRLRDALPVDSPLTTDGPDVTWAGGHLTSDSTTFERTAREALRLRGRARLEADLRALAVTERGEYLPGSTTEWVQDRRRALRIAATDLRLDAAEVAFGLDELERARHLVDAVLEEDPYRESAWRLSMRIAAAMGHDDRVIALFIACRDRLAELPTTPAASTQRLLDQLRR
ncbi:BTAD domain-containing putative transcriptional regulator [Patulibacter minatonensis]|uniref:BTAD domain-containing putative transcriptional regulator n=1 Tax=Patulibacter minatonensis TaxID=298163 RepID=UPI0012FCDAAE|nr:BTAD domain-containing putative transcriptional regulator [Patulibacter minatonensis]